MKTISRFFLFTVLLFSSAALPAQNYQNAIGLRGGWYDGITFRHMLSESTALEGLFMSRWRGWDITCLYEFQKPLKEDGFDWYYGGGAHIGGYNPHYYYQDLNTHYYDQGYDMAVGVDGIIGMEYTFKEIPLNLGIDIHPLLDVSGGKLWFWYDAAFSVRFVLD